MERRKRRSDRVDEALSHWLAALRNARGARAAAIGTTDGLPIATSGDVDPLWLAAAGSQVARGARVDVGDVDGAVIQLRGGDAVVLAVCGQPAPTDAEVGRHIRRMLS